MSNGRLPASDLAAIPGGRLRKDAAAAWNDMRDYIGKRHGVWIAPTGSRSSYRSYADQVYFWNLYQSGRGNLAAYPGTSNHGWGVAVDVASQTMAYYIRQYGARFGWKKTEAFSEWWHYNYVGGYRPPKKPDSLKGLLKHERHMAERLIYHRRQYEKEAKTGKGARYRRHYGWAKYWKYRVDRQRIKISKVAKRHGWSGNNRGLRYHILSRVYNKKIR